MRKPFLCISGKNETSKTFEGGTYFWRPQNQHNTMHCLHNHNGITLWLTGGRKITWSPIPGVKKSGPPLKISVPPGPKLLMFPMPNYNFILFNPNGKSTLIMLLGGRMGNNREWETNEKVKGEGANFFLNKSRSTYFWQVVDGGHFIWQHQFKTHFSSILCKKD